MFDFYHISAILAGAIFTIIMLRTKPKNCMPYDPIVGIMFLGIKLIDMEYKWIDKQIKKRQTILILKSAYIADNQVFHSDF